MNFLRTHPPFLLPFNCFSIIRTTSYWTLDYCVHFLYQLCTYICTYGNWNLEIDWNVAFSFKKLTFPLFFVRFATPTTFYLTYLLKTWLSTFTFTFTFVNSQANSFGTKRGRKSRFNVFYMNPIIDIIELSNMYFSQES